MNANTSAGNGLAKVEFVCMNCKEGHHGCQGCWIGLGLEIWCMCPCVSRVVGADKDNIKDHYSRKLSTKLPHSKTDTRTVLVTNDEEAT